MSNRSFIETRWRVAEMKSIDGQKDAVSILHTHLYTFICKDCLTFLRPKICRSSVTVALVGYKEYRTGNSAKLVSVRSFVTSFLQHDSLGEFTFFVLHATSLRAGPYHCSSVFWEDAAIIRPQVPAMMEADFDWWQSWDHNRRQGRIPGIESPTM